MVSASVSGDVEQFDQRKIFGVIGASAVGTMIEYYDFYIFGSLASVVAAHFYPSGNATAALLAVLATFGAGFAARPFGALVFGRIGDRIGRKYAFLFTLLVMGGATFVIGLLPDYSAIGIAAPLLLVTIRIIQGLALGGEYGGAAVYVAEHVPQARRGFYTSFIQTTATLGLFLSLIVILTVSQVLPDATWKAWGWRIPFLLSSVLVIISILIRLRLKESPLFTQLKAEGKISKAPVSDSLNSKVKWQTILMVLWGAIAGQAVIWYTGQFYALSWLQNAKIANVKFVDSNYIIAIGLALGTPFFIVFGSLSDRIGRKKVMMAGNLLGAIFIVPLFAIMYKFTPLSGNYQPVVLVLCVWLLVILVTMVYGPIAAFLVESFPSKVRYTSVSLPYHIGNGYLGGFLPLIATALFTAASKNPSIASIAPFVGLAFPVTVALITFVVGTWLLRETKDNSMTAPLTNQRGYSPVVFGALIGLSVIAFVLADTFLTPTLNSATFNVQGFFRILVLVVVLASVIFMLARRGKSTDVETDTATEPRLQR